MQIRHLPRLAALALLGAVIAPSALAQTSTSRTWSVKFTTAPTGIAEKSCGLAYQIIHWVPALGGTIGAALVGKVGLQRAGNMVGAFTVTRFTFEQRGGKVEDVRSVVVSAWLRSPAGLDLADDIEMTVPDYDNGNRVVLFEGEGKFRQVLTDSVRAGRLLLVYKLDDRVPAFVLPLELDVLDQDADEKPIRTRRDLDRFATCLQALQPR